MPVGWHEAGTVNRGGSACTRVVQDNAIAIEQGLGLVKGELERIAGRGRHDGQVLFDDAGALRTPLVISLLNRDLVSAGKQGPCIPAVSGSLCGQVIPNVRGPGIEVSRLVIFIIPVKNGLYRLFG